MTWLYGDSSKSPLEINYIDFLRLMIDFSVEAVLAEEQIATGRERRYRLESEAEEELARLDALGASATAAAVAPGMPDEAPVARCAAAIRRAAAAAVKSEVSSVKAALVEQIARIDGRAHRERERCVKALESLLLRYDLPETRTATHLEASAGGYTARLRAVTGYGLEMVLELEVPAENPFAHEVRIDRFMEGLEVKVPEVGGWLRKQSRIVPHRLGKHRITRLSSSAGEMSFELRLGADPHAAGFNITISNARAVTLTPVAKDDDGKGSGPPFEPDAEDSARLLQVSERLAGAVAELAHSRKALLEARLDGEPLQAQARPSILVERLIAAVAPTVRDIARFSLSPSELVLRRLLGGDRREEVFVSRTELAQKLEALPPARRPLFDLLALVDEPADGAQGSSRPATEPVEAEMIIEAEPAEPIVEREPEPAPDPTVSVDESQLLPEPSAN